MPIIRPTPPVGAFGERPAHARPTSASPRRSKADSLRLVHRLKQGIVVIAIVAFGVFGGLVATHLPALGASAASSSTTSGTTSSSSTSTSTSSGGFFGQGSSGSGVSGTSSSSTSSSASSPITTTSAS